MRNEPADASVAIVFTALADPARRQVVELLGQAPHRAGELAAAVGMSAPAMSRHLRVLLEAGIVVDERTARDARLRYFRLRPTSMVAVQAWLDQLQAHFDEQLASFKRHVDRHHLGDRGVGQRHLEQGQLEQGQLDQGQLDQRQLEQCASQQQG